jgi:hypothetical protein
VCGVELHHVRHSEISAAASDCLSEFFVSVLEDHARVGKFVLSSAAHRNQFTTPIRSYFEVKLFSGAIDLSRDLKPEVNKMAAFLKSLILT